ncbi:MAG: prephenate dehydrogenase [Candidatus Cyclobacteriaceae bacterium M3_2C_046]
MKVCIIGLGLIGGSFSLGLKQKINDLQVVGVDVNPHNCDKALELGITDEINNLPVAIKGADLVVVATPVNVMTRQLYQVLDLIDPETIVVDMGSTKYQLGQAVEKHVRRSRYVSSHPIAGTENSGPEAAFGNLMKHKIMIICDKEKSDPDALDKVVEIYHTLEMKISYMNSASHDQHIAYVSHLSHISSFALGSTVLDKEKDEKNIFDMAGSGFSSTVRLAKSSADMWAPIFTQNKRHVLEALDAYIKKLVYFRDIIEREDEQQSKELMRQTNQIRRVLLGIEKNGQ